MGEIQQGARRFSFSACQSEAQTSAGGETLAQQTWEACGTRNYVFFTRKGTPEEGLHCLRRGALDVIKKPDPSSTLAQEKSGKIVDEAQDEAFRDRSPKIAAELLGAIRRAWWWKHREAVYSALLGFFVGILANAVTQILYG